MSKRNFIIIIYIVIACISSFYKLNAQTRITWSSEIFKPSSSTSFQFVGNWNEGFMMQARTRTKLFSQGKTILSRFDNFTLLPQFNKEIQLETTKGNKSLEYQVLERVGDYPVLFATYYNKERDKIELYGRKYNIDGDPIDREKKITEFKASRKSQLESLNFVLSSDSSRMLTYYSERFDKYSNEKIEFQMFNDELETVFSRNIEFPYKGRNFSIHHVKIDPSGRVYLLVKVQYEKDQAEYDIRRFRYGLVTFAGEETPIEDYEVILEENFIADIDFDIESNGDIVCAGFYSKRGLNRASGSFFLKIDRNLNAVSEKRLTPFDPQFSARFTESSRLRNRSEITDFKLDHMVRFDDGSRALIAEQFLIQEICYQDFRTGMFTCNYVYFYNNIIVVKMESDGLVAWTADIPKYQESSNDMGVYSSYVFSKSGSNLYFVYNDHEKNLKSKGERDVYVMNNVRRSVPILATIDIDGRFKKEPLQSEGKSRLFLIPIFSTQLSEQSMLLLGMTTNKYRVGIIPLRN